MVTTPRRTAASVAPVLVAMALVLSSCSSTSSGSGSKATGSSASTPTSSASSAPGGSSGSAGTRPALAAIVVQAADLPATYKSTAYDPDPDAPARKAALVSCTGAKDTSADKTGEEHSAEFGLNDISISSQAESYASQSDIDANVALLMSPKIDSCYEDSFRKLATEGLPAGSTVDALKVTVSPGANGGPSNVVAVASASLTATISGRSTTLVISVAFITGPSLLAEVDIQNVDGPIPTDVVSQAVAAVAARAAKG